MAINLLKKLKAVIDAKSQQRFYEINLGNIRKEGNQLEEQKETIANPYKYYNKSELVTQLFAD